MIKMSFLLVLFG